MVCKPSTLATTNFLKLPACFYAFTYSISLNPPLWLTLRTRSCVHALSPVVLSSPLRIPILSAWCVWGLSTRKKLFPSRITAAIASLFQKSFFVAGLRLLLPKAQIINITLMPERVNALRPRGPPRACLLTVGLTSLKRVYSRKSCLVFPRWNMSHPAQVRTRIPLYSGARMTRTPFRLPKLPWFAALLHYCMLSFSKYVSELLLVSTSNGRLSRTRPIKRGMHMRVNFLAPPPGPRKQLLPVLPACAKHMCHYWRDPLDLKHGLMGLEVKDMASCGLGDPPPPPHHRTLDC